MPRELKTYHHLTVKVCSSCEVEKSIDQFHFKRRDTGLRNAFCISCQKIIKSKHYVDNKGLYRQRAKERRAKLILEVQGLKGALCCSKCGESHIATLHFHHVNPKDKDANVASALRDGWSIARLKKEIEKCIVLCANCHSILHYDEQQLLKV